MAKKHFTPEQIITKLREAEVVQSQEKALEKPAGNRESPNRHTIVGARNTAG